MDDFYGGDEFPGPRKNGRWSGGGGHVLSCDHAIRGYCRWAGRLRKRLPKPGLLLILASLLLLCPIEPENEDSDECSRSDYIVPNTVIFNIE